MRFSTTFQSRTGGIVHEYTRPILPRGCVSVAIRAALEARATGGWSPSTPCHAAVSQRDHDGSDSPPGLPKPAPSMGSTCRRSSPRLRAEFPQLVTYSSIAALIPRILLPLAVYLQTQRGSCTGVSCSDSTALAVCKLVAPLRWLVACRARTRRCHHVCSRRCQRGLLQTDQANNKPIQLAAQDVGADTPGRCPFTAQVNRHCASIDQPHRRAGPSAAPRHRLGLL